MSGWVLGKKSSALFYSFDLCFDLLTAPYFQYMLYTALGRTIMMQRTQVYFDPETLELLRQEAEEKEITLARVIREKVEKNIKKKRARKKQMNAAEALMHLAELGEKLGVNGPRDLSQRIDELVYRT